MPAQPHIYDVSDDTFSDRVLAASASLPVVVDFWAPWCEPCRRLAPLIEKVAGDYPNEVNLARLNTDDNPRTAMAYAIKGIPAVKAFRGGKVVSEFTGLLPEAQVRTFFAGLIPTAAEKAIAEGFALLESDPAAAELHFREALSKGTQSDAVVGLATLLLNRGDIDEATKILDRAPTDRRAKILRHGIFLDGFAARHDSAQLEAEARAEPASPRARYRWGVMLAAQGRHQEALDELLESVRLDRAMADGAARKAVLAVFDLLGLDSPLTREYQRKLSMLLF